MQGNRLKKRLAEGHVTTIMGDADSADTIEYYGSLGLFDSVWIEMEHGPISWANLADMSRAADIWGMTSVVRVRAIDRELIALTLGLGVDGIIIPHVNTRQEAELVVDSALFTPLGNRGAGGGRKAYGRPDYFTTINDDTFISIMIEDIIAIENISEILEVPHIDVFFVSRFDLAQSMGFLHDVNNPAVIEAHTHAIQSIAAAGKVAGGVMAEKDLQKYIEMGVRFTKVNPRKWIADGAKAWSAKLEEAEANAKAPAVA
jgi:2-keto-3-deoxy-L-rhamnonate aldolase RhmA